METNNENNFTSISDDDLFERFKNLEIKYKKFSEEFESYLQNFRNIRTELLLIERELHKRGVLKDGSV